MPQWSLGRKSARKMKATKMSETPKTELFYSFGVGVGVHSISGTFGYFVGKKGTFVEMLLCTFAFAGANIDSV